MRRRIPTYVSGLDEEIGGGIPDGHVALLKGTTGTMKTSLAFYVLYRNALAGRPGLYITLEQSAESLLNHVRSLGLDPEAMDGRLPLFDLSRGREALLEIAAKVKLLRPAAGQPSLSAIFQGKVAELKRQFGFELLVLDSLEAFEVLSEFDDRRAQLFSFFEWLRDLSCTSLVVSEGASAFQLAPEAPDEEFLADSILELKLFPTADLDVQRRLRCAKMRSTHHSTDYHTLVFEKGQFEVTKAIA